MGTTNATPQATPEKEPKQTTKKIQLTVFDLGSFDKVRLAKQIILPDKLTEISQALEAVGNDQVLFLDIFWRGLCELTEDQEKEKVECHN